VVENVIIGVHDAVN
jgi:hypothetical protein